MPPIGRGLGIALVVGIALGCSATSVPSPDTAVGPTPTSRTTPPRIGASASAPSSPAPPAATAAPLPQHQVIRGSEVAGAFDLATDGTVIAWSAGTIDVDAPDLWALEPGSAPPSGKVRRVFRSGTPRAILANVAARSGTYAFAEITPRSDGSRTWRLVLLDTAGATHVLDVNDLPREQTGVLPMAAISDRGVLWATSHRGDGQGPRCELRYAAFGDLRSMVVASAPCGEIEFWCPRSDGRRFVYGTVEYRAAADDERHVYLADERDLGTPRRLDLDGEASLPAILDDTVVWKAAPRELNMFSPAGLQALDLATSNPARPLSFPSVGPAQLTLPSIGPGFIVGEDASGGGVSAWDRARGAAWDIDVVPSGDPGFLSGTRLGGELLAWFYTSATGGGGVREVRWLLLPSG